MAVGDPATSNASRDLPNAGATRFTKVEEAILVILTAARFILSIIPQADDSWRSRGVTSNFSGSP